MTALVSNGCAIGGGYTALVRRSSDATTDTSGRDTQLELNGYRDVGRGRLGLDFGLGSMAVRTRSTEMMQTGGGETSFLSVRFTAYAAVPIATGAITVTPLVLYGKGGFAFEDQTDIKWAAGGGVEFAPADAKAAAYMRATGQYLDLGGPSATALVISFGVRYAEPWW